MRHAITSFVTLPYLTNAAKGPINLQQFHILIENLQYIFLYSENKFKDGEGTCSGWGELPIILIGGGLDGGRP